VQNGVAFELPTLAHHTQGLGFSSLPIFPTPLASEYKVGNGPAEWRRNTIRLATLVHGDDWDKYAPAMERWAEIIGRPAPQRVKHDGQNGAPRLNPEFVQWVMGLPDGWVTNVGLSRIEQIKACGNGVVPQQAKLALSILLDGVEW
jgi:DNA (cytosine-5)-methyltransferase 1